MRFAIFLFSGPYWVQGFAALFFGFISVSIWQGEQEKAQARLTLLNAPPPMEIAIADLKQHPESKVQEVNLRAVIATKHNTRLVETTNFVKTDEDLLIVLQDETASTSEPLVRAVIVLDPKDQDKFSQWVGENVVNLTATGPVVALNGLITNSQNQDHINDVFKKYGLKMADNYVHLQPFFLPRHKALAQEPRYIPWFSIVLSLGLALLGYFKWRAKRARSRSTSLLRPQTFTHQSAMATPALTQQTSTAAWASTAAPAAAHSPFAAAPAPKAKAKRGIVYWLLGVPLLIFYFVWKIVDGYFRTSGESISADTWSSTMGIMGTLLSVLLIPACIYFLFRSAFRSARAIVPSPAPMVAQPPKPMVKDSPIISAPSLGERISGSLIPQKMLNWVPLAAAIILYFAAPRIMEIFKVHPMSDQIGGGDARQQNAPTLLNDPILGLSGGLMGLVAAILALLAINWVLKRSVLWGARQLDPNLKDPWERIEAERRNLG